MTQVGKMASRYPIASGSIVADFLKQFREAAPLKDLSQGELKRMLALFQNQLNYHEIVDDKVIQDPESSLAKVALSKFNQEQTSRYVKYCFDKFPGREPSFTFRTMVEWLRHLLKTTREMRSVQKLKVLELSQGNRSLKDERKLVEDMKGRAKLLKEKIKDAELTNSKGLSSSTNQLEPQGLDIQEKFDRMSAIERFTFARSSYCELCLFPNHEIDKCPKQIRLAEREQQSRFLSPELEIYCEIKTLFPSTRLNWADEMERSDSEQQFLSAPENSDWYEICVKDFEQVTLSPKSGEQATQVQNWSSVSSEIRNRLELAFQSQKEEGSKVSQSFKLPIMVSDWAEEEEEEFKLHLTSTPKSEFTNSD